MKRVEITVPAEDRDTAEEIIKEFDDPTASEVEKDDRTFISFSCTVDSEAIDELTQRLKEVKDLESGELTIDVLEETALIEKGKRREGGTQSLSVQEMYAKAFEFATFTRTSWALIILSTGIAVFGTITENMMVVIGAMVIAPMLGPFMSTSFGLVIGDRKIIQPSIKYGLLSIAVAILSAFVLGLPIPVEPNPLMRLISDPGFSTIPLSLCVGAASALTFATEARESLAGVAVAIALVPPSAVAGLAMAMGNYDMLFRVMLVIISNVASLILAGSVTFKLLGITPSTYYRKQVSKEQLSRALYISGGILLIITGLVGFVSYNDLRQTYEQSAITAELDSQFGNRMIYSDIRGRSDRVDITVAIVNPQISKQELLERLGQHTTRDIQLSLISVSGEEA